MSITINLVIIVVIVVNVTIGMEKVSGVVRKEETISGSRKMCAN